MVFTEPKPAHDEVIKRVLYQHAQLRGEGTSAAEEGVADAGEAGDDHERSTLFEVGMRDEPDDERAEADKARIDDILNTEDTA
jgi:hypothetical protein